MNEKNSNLHTINVYDKKVQDEYNRIKDIFVECDEKQLKLIDGAIIEAARIKVELDKSYDIIKETGKLKMHPNKKELQKELPVSKLIVKDRANYLNYISKLSNLLGKNLDNDDEEELNEYE